jgi:acyl-CoA thioester hydrolase
MNGGEVRVAVRWQDVDGLGHVNHVMFLVYLEEGRDAWLRGHGIRRDEYVVGRCTVHYRREILPDVATVLVRTGAAEVGRSSLTTSQLMLDEDGNVLAEAEFALVMWDPRERRSRPLSDEERRSLEANMEAMR